MVDRRTACIFLGALLGGSVALFSCVSRVPDSRDTAAWAKGVGFGRSQFRSTSQVGVGWIDAFSSGIRNLRLLSCRFVRESKVLFKVAGYGEASRARAEGTQVQLNHASPGADPPALRHLPVSQF